MEPRAFSRSLVTASHVPKFLWSAVSGAETAAALKVAMGIRVLGLGLQPAH